MNINNVFICDVYEFVDHCLADCYSDEKFNILINNIKDENGLSKLEKKVLFIKKALVYYSKIQIVMLIWKQGKYIN